MIADCLHALALPGPAEAAALLLALLLAGLAGGLTHCAGMCAPFVLAQAATGPGAGGGRLARLAGAALLPYQAGRLAGYAMLGALAGGFSGRLPGGGWLAPALLLLASIAMLGQAGARLGLAARLPALPGIAPPARLLRFLLAAPQGWRGLGLGLLLAGLPCGLLYGALAAAAATGSPAGGALAMAAFCLGTMPALVALALLGRFLARRAGPGLRRASALLLGVNALLLAGLAARLMLR
ncbi:sulfite exporter TauE/SafE family protein [Roseomonas sp. 18066]|uniref:urease accessory protein UreH domain-containing protein n=1 Tax=Roseomonas sp. 18066 TaxID=2681412 RepID=UPI00135CB2FF|nr:sulfite exporter TauE/SafE family protein [Roseomonas sp. 18066]